MNKTPPYQFNITAPPQQRFTPSPYDYQNVIGDNQTGQMMIPTSGTPEVPYASYGISPNQTQVHPIPVSPQYNPSNNNNQTEQNQFGNNALRNDDGTTENRVLMDMDSQQSIPTNLSLSFLENLLNDDQMAGQSFNNLSMNIQNDMEENISDSLKNISLEGGLWGADE